MTFKERVIQVVKSIPRGQTASYKDVATKAGNPLAARVVGNIMAWNHDRAVPCHRVINSNGKIGGYNGLRGKKIELLRAEGAM